MKIMLPLLATLFLGAAPALALDRDDMPGRNRSQAAIPAAEKNLTTPRQRMVDCNKEASDRKGDARRDFMRECLHGDAKPGATPASPAKMTQQDRMGHCNKLAGDKRGPERRAFMRVCLKK